jgi:hypothetical protein
MSNLPRLNVPGLRWAPSQPCLAGPIPTLHRPGVVLGTTVGIDQVYDGIGSRSTGPLERGGALGAVWQVYEATISADLCSSSSITSEGTVLSNQVLGDIGRQLSMFDKCVRLLQPAANYPLPENNAVLYRGVNGGTLVAIVSHHAKNAWKWEGLYEWPVEVKMPPFEEMFLLLV